MNRFAIAVPLALLVACRSPPPQVPAPIGKPVAWPKPAPRKSPTVKATDRLAVPPGEVIREPVPEPEPPPPAAAPRPPEDEPDPTEVIQRSERAKEDATNYVLAPHATTEAIDTLTVLTRIVRRVRDIMETRREVTGQYDPEDVRALQKASDALENYRASKGD